MRKEKHRYSRELAWRVLLENGVSALPVDVAGVCRSYGMAVKAYDPAGDNPGQGYLLDGRPVIAVSRREPKERQRFICAHEMGHLLLGHAGAWGRVRDNSDLPRREQERAAMVFAAELLMPSCVLSAIGVEDADRIMALCGVPYRAAFFALKERQRRGMALSEEEERVCEMFHSMKSMHR